MKFRLNKLVAGLALAGSVVALVACGGGGTPDLRAPDVPEIAVDATIPTSVAKATAVLSALEGTVVNLDTAATSQAFAVGNTTYPVVTLPAATKITLSAVPTGAETGAMSGFSMTDNGGTTTGYVVPGSCVFVVKTVATGSSLFVGQRIKFEPCAFDVASSGVANGTTQTVPLTIKLGNSIVKTTVTVTVTSTATGGAEITVKKKDGTSVVIGTGTFTGGV